jgi:hypothetical protein
VVSSKTTGFWDVTSCKLIVSNCSEETSVSIFRVYKVENESSMFLQSVGTYPPNCKALHSRILQS